MGETLILGIETSCDETSAAVVRDGREILSNVIYSQIETHALYGGVVPEIASRAHLEKVWPVVREALAQSGVDSEELSAVAVTCGPGLVGPLLVGVSFAKAYAYGCGKPLVGVHHINGHICANYLYTEPTPPQSSLLCHTEPTPPQSSLSCHSEGCLSSPKNLDVESSNSARAVTTALAPPFLCLVVSGGHSHLVAVKDYGLYEVIGRTHDDAAGEALDKIARALGIDYPGGPGLERLAKGADPAAITFPRAHVENNEYGFSFSGVKSSALNHINSMKMNHQSGADPQAMPFDTARADIAASFQAAVVDALVSNTIKAALAYGFKQVALAGGVAANGFLREHMRSACAEHGLEMYCPPPILCTDNAAMIASAGYFDYKAGKRAGLDLNAYPNLPM